MATCCDSITHTSHQKCGYLHGQICRRNATQSHNITQWLTALLLFVFTTWLNPPCHAVGELESVAASSGIRAVKPAVDILTSIAEIPMNAAEIAYLPLGAVQVALSPLPGIGFMDGLTNIGRGIVAPFNLIIGVMSLPYKAVNGIATTGAAITGE